MAKVIRCDRCGRIFEENCGISIAISYQVYQGDLCDRCHNDFKSFMKNEDVFRQYVIRKENNND